MMRGRRVDIWRAAVLALAMAASPAPAATVGQPAPAFRLTLLDGTRVSLPDLRGKVVVLNFWATWCVPCKAELPLLDAYYKAQRAAGLQVYAVTTEDSLPLSQLKPLAALMTIPMVRHLSGGYAPLTGVPTNYIIDRAGVLRYAKAGALDLDRLNALLVPLLNESAGSAVTPLVASGIKDFAAVAGGNRLIGR